MTTHISCDLEKDLRKASESDKWTADGFPCASLPSSVTYIMKDMTSIREITTLTAPSEPFYSSLPPFTVLGVDGKISNPFGQPSFGIPSNVDLPASLPQHRLRDPDEIQGPAIISHDYTWRCLTRPTVFASEKAKKVGQKLFPDSQFE